MFDRSFFPTLFNNSTNPWNGFPEFARLQSEFSKVFSPGEYPALNVWSNDEETVVTAELPGFDPKDIEISVEGSTLTLKGSRNSETSNEGEGDKYFQKERWSGKFARSLKLPAQVDADKVEAEFNSGVLSVRLPKAEAFKPKKIAVKAN